MIHSARLKVKKIIKETDQAVSIELEIPKELQTEFQYVSGQYLTFISSIQNEELRRSYSLCSSPEESKWKVAVKEVEGGRFSNFACQKLKEGDELEVLPPNGKFCLPSKIEDSDQFLLIAAGSGITPVISMIKTILHSSNATVFLLYGNQNSDQIIFKDELLDLKNQFVDRLSLHFILSQEIVEEELFYGRIDVQKIRAFDKKLFDLSKIKEIFMCGPEAMILDLKSEFIAKGLRDDQIHFELFGIAAVSKPKSAIVHKDGNCMVNLKLDGRTMNFNLEFNTNSILDAALKNKANLPYACKGGVCCTCKAKLLSGKVNMYVNYGLEPDEIANGYILTCQSYPESDEVSIDFDV